MKTNIASNFAYVIKTANQESKLYTVAKLANSLLQATFPLLIVLFPKLMIDRVTNGLDWNGVLRYAVLWLVLGITYTVLNVFLSLYIQAREEVLRTTFGLKVCAKTVSLDMEQLETADIQAMREKCETVNQQNMCVKLYNDAFDLFASLLSAAATFAILISLDLWIFAAILLYLAAATWFTHMQLRANHVGWNFLQEINRKVHYYTSTMNNPIYAKEVRMFSLSDWLLRKYKTTKKEYLDTQYKFYKIFQKLTLGSTIVDTIFQIFLYVYFAARMIFNALSFGNFTMMLSAVQEFTTSANKISHILINAFDRSSYIDHYRQYLDLPSQISVRRPDARPVPQGERLAIRFQELSFSYPGSDKKVIDGLDLALEPQQFYMLVGVNGAGKTTLFNLMCRLYDPREGTILLNGTDIREFDCFAYRNLFGVVFQDYQYYAFTIAENVAMDAYDGSEEVRAKIQDCLEKAGLWEKVASLEKGIDTSLRQIFDASGVNLSGGEAQKLALAKALFRDTPIILLDEPSSALDALAEDELITRFKEVSRRSQRAAQ